MWRSDGRGQGRRLHYLGALLLLVALLVMLRWGQVRGGLAADPAPSEPRSGSQPASSGPSDGGRIVFRDEFKGSSVDWDRWADTATAEADAGRGNPENGQLEWNQADNCSVDDGVLTITAKPDKIRAESGAEYDWSSCLLNSSPSFTFQYGYLEARVKLPAPPGFWAAFWTWQADGNTTWTETDVFEFYSHEQSTLHLTQHSGDGGSCTLTGLQFDPSNDFHTYAADIHPDGTDYYIDGDRVCSARGTSTGETSVILDMFVYADVPPEPGTAASMQVDYVRAWAS